MVSMERSQKVHTIHLDGIGSAYYVVREDSFETNEKTWNIIIAQYITARLALKDVTNTLNKLHLATNDHF
jgi:hypothetical protein